MTTAATKKRQAKKAEEIAAREESAAILTAAFKANCKDPQSETFDDPVWNQEHRLYGRVQQLITNGLNGGAAEAQARKEEADGTLTAVAVLPAAEGEQLDELAAWLEAQTWSDFAQSLAKQWRTKEWLSEKQIASATSMREKVEAKATAKKAAEPTRETGLDLSALPSGYYADPDEGTRLKLRISRGKNEPWKGVIFVNDDAEYGSRKRYGMQKVGQPYRGDVADVLTRIMAAPKKSSAAYGRLVGHCGVCGRRLEDKDSIAKGIGPICEEKF